MRRLLKTGIPGLAMIFSVGCVDPIALIDSYLFSPDDFECFFVIDDVELYDATPADFGLDYDVFTVSSQNGNQISGWFIPATTGQRLGTVLFNNSSSGARSCYLANAELLAGSGYNMVMYNYQGFGESEGSKSIENIVPDARAVLEWTFDSDDPSRRSVALMGVSLGTGPSIRLATEFPDQVWAVVLDSPYLVPTVSNVPSLGGLIDLFVPLILVAFPENMDNEVNVLQMQAPLMILHGTLDVVTPIEEGSQLFEIAPHAVEFVEFENSGHTGAVFDETQRYREEVISFLKAFAPVE